jgi:hypothetical protein
MGKTLGKTYEQRELSKEVRDLALEEIRDILKGKIEVDKRFREALILKLAGTVLPRLNEISGPDGGDIPMPIYGGKSNQEL